MNNELNKKIIIIFSGFNQRAIIAFLRTLEKNSIKYAIIAKSDDDEIFNTSYKEKVILTRNNVELEIEDLTYCIEYVKKQFDVKSCLIAPSTESLNRFILEYREYFEDIGCTIPIVGEELYKLISDKILFNNLCLKWGIKVPESIDISKKVKFPIVAKPKVYTLGKQTFYPVIINSAEELNEFFEENIFEQYYYQRYITGESIYILYYFSKGGQVYSFSQKNLVQQSNGKSMIAAIPTDFHDTKEAKKYENMLKKIGFFGLVMIEVKKENNDIYMIEANPRFWGPSQLFVDVGMNFFEFLLYDYGYVESVKCININKDIKYFWYGGLLNEIRNKKDIKFYVDKEEFYIKLKEWIKSDFIIGTTLLIYL